MLANHNGISAGFEARGDAIYRRAIQDWKVAINSTRHEGCCLNARKRMPTIQNYSSARSNRTSVGSGNDGRSVQFQNASLTELADNRNFGMRSPERRLHRDFLLIGTNRQFGSAIPHPKNRSDALPRQDGPHIETAALNWPFLRALASTAISRGGPVGSDKLYSHEISGKSEILEVDEADY